MPTLAKQKEIGKGLLTPSSNVSMSSASQRHKPPPFYNMKAHTHVQLTMVS